MKSFEIKELNATDEQFPVAVSRLAAVLEKGKLSSRDIDQVLLLSNKLIIADFLREYQYFDDKNMVRIKAYILLNLDNEDRMFVSDLIEFADLHELELPYAKCIEYLDQFTDENVFVQLAAIDYISFNIKMNHIDQIKAAMDRILGNRECARPVQIKAAFFLFRITHKKKYLSDLLDLVVTGTEGNKKLLKNILICKGNERKFFDYNSVIGSILRK